MPRQPLSLRCGPTRRWSRPGGGRSITTCRPARSTFDPAAPGVSTWRGMGPTIGRMAPTMRSCRGERLLFSYLFPEFKVQSVVSVRLEAEGQGTRMRFLQTGFPDAENHAGHAGGWSSTFAILEDLVLKLHGIGSVYPTLPPARVSGVAHDLAERGGVTTRRQLPLCPDGTPPRALRALVGRCARSARSARRALPVGRSATAARAP
jgi:hypothetical protein